MKMFNKKGFTLIELLVVIAIIGILASIVLVSFPSAQKKASDSKVISAIAQARTVMTYYGANNGDSYSGFSCASPDMSVLCAEVLANGSKTALYTVAVGTADACMSVLLSAKAVYYCADATGVAKETATACVTATAKCP